MNWPHWIVVPVVLPLIAGAACLLLERRAANVARALSTGSTLVLLGVALYLAGVAASGAVHPYLLGNWTAPFGIALALDRLSALMLVLTAIVISFAMTALLLVIALVARAETDSDHVDGEEPQASEERR